MRDPKISFMTRWNGIDQEIGIILERRKEGKTEGKENAKRGSGRCMTGKVKYWNILHWYCLSNQ